MSIFLKVAAFLAGVAATVPLSAHAAPDTLSVTVTPPLFQLSIIPGETWNSSLKVVNSNTYDVTYYAEVVNFKAEGEAGQGTFIPLTADDADARAHTLAGWIEIPKDPITIPKGRSGEIPLTVHIPADASPGGHYAAILVGTKPPETVEAGAAMRISSFVTSLLFVRVKGDVYESARIREFRTTQTLYQEPQADFILRFENTGNAHLQPQGYITLFNMWGKERGKVLINQQSNFGNVLPESTRKFQFSWEGEQDIFDIGRYSAEVTLTFGENGRQNISSKTYFWIVPVVPVAVTIGSIAFFVLLIVWFIRRYIRRALVLERQYAGIGEHSKMSAGYASVFMQPLREGVVDLRSVAKQQPSVGSGASTTERQMTGGMFVKKYYAFFLFLGVVGAALYGIQWFLGSVLTPERHFEIKEVKIQEERPITDEDVAKLNAQNQQ